MKKQIVLITMLLSSINIIAQKFMVDSTLQIKKTEIIIINHNTIDDKIIKIRDRTLNSISDSSYSKDTLRLTFSKRGLAGQTLTLKVTDTIIPEITPWSDYPAFNGKSYKSLEMERTELIVNRRNLSSGDTLMIKLKCISKPHEGYIGRPKFEYSGIIRHIVQIK